MIVRELRIVSPERALELVEQGWTLTGKGSVYGAGQVSLIVERAVRDAPASEEAEEATDLDAGHASG